MDLHPDRAALNNLDPNQTKEDLAKVMAAYEMLRKHHRLASHERYRAMRREPPVYYRDRAGYTRRWEARKDPPGATFRGTQADESDEEFYHSMENFASRYAIAPKTRNRALLAWFGSICAYFAWDFREYRENMYRRGQAGFPTLQIRGVR